MNRVSLQHHFGAKSHIPQHRERCGKVNGLLWAPSKMLTQRAYQAHFVAIVGEKCDFMA